MQSSLVLGYSLYNAFDNLFVFVWTITMQIMDGLNVDQVVEFPDTPDSLTSQNINVIDCTSDISDGEWRNKNKQATRTNSRRMFNIQKIASRTTPPNKSAFYPKGNVVDNTPNRLASHDINVIDCASAVSDDLIGCVANSHI